MFLVFMKLYVRKHESGTLGERETRTGLNELLPNVLEGFFLRTWRQFSMRFVFFDNKLSNDPLSLSLVA